jgi:hypothetical protein
VSFLSIEIWYYDSHIDTGIQGKMLIMFSRVYVLRVGKTRVAKVTVVVVYQLLLLPHGEKVGMRGGFREKVRLFRTLSSSVVFNFFVRGMRVPFFLRQKAPKGHDKRYERPICQEQIGTHFSAPVG